MKINKVLEKKVENFLRSQQLEKIKERKSKFRTSLVCNVCQKRIRNLATYGGSPGGWNWKKDRTIQSAKKSIVNKWEYFHWICKRRNPSLLLLHNIFNRKGNYHHRHADLFYGTIDEMPLRIHMGKKKRNWKCGVYFGDCSSLSKEAEGNARNLSVGYELSATQWFSVVRYMKKAKPRYGFCDVKIGSNGYISVTADALPLLSRAINIAESRRQEFLLALSKDPEIHGPSLFDLCA